MAVFWCHFKSCDSEVEICWDDCIRVADTAASEIWYEPTKITANK